VYQNAEGQGVQDSVLQIILHWTLSYVIPGFRLEVIQNCALLGCYAASSGNLLPTFRDNLSAPSSRVKNPYPGTNIAVSNSHRRMHS
jgi:hypothetical protein